MHKVLLKDGFTAKVLVTVSLLIFMIFSIIYYVVYQEFQEARDAEVDRYIKIVEQSIDEAYDFTDSYEEVLDNSLYHLAKNIGFELQGKELDSLSEEDLENLKEKYQLAGLAIFKATYDDIVIVNSTLKDEIGTSTKDWGYWHTAFRELLDGEVIDVGRGYAQDNVWVGPKSLSYYAEGYHKYAYIRPDQAGYLINPFIMDDTLTQLEAAGNLDQMLDDIKTNIDHIEAIGVVDAEAWKAYKNDNYDGNGDPLVVYGAVMKSTYLNSRYDIDTILASQEKLVENLPTGNQMNIYMPIRDNRILIIRVNSAIFDALLRNILFVFIGVGVIASAGIMIIAYMLVGNYTALLDLEKQRLKLANTFRKTVKKLPDLIYHCRLSEQGNIMLSYNEGKFFKDEDIVLVKDNEVLMEDIYKREFMDAAQNSLMKAFQKERVRFEASIHGQVFDNIVSPIFDEGFDEKTGYVKEIIGFATDISERIKKQEKATFLAYHDALTGLPNRLKLNAYLNQLLRQEGDSPFYVMFFDLDGFKRVNDEAGYQTGDTVLKEIGGRIQALVNEEAMVFHMSADEFLIVARYRARIEVENLAKRVLAFVEMPITVRDKTFELKTSIGIAAYPEDGEHLDALIEAADQAMHESKSVQGSCYQFKDQIYIQ